MSGSRSDRRTVGREGERGNHEKYIQFVGRLLGKLQLYGGKGGGGVDRDEEIQYHRGGGAVSYQDSPHPPPLTSTTSPTDRSGLVIKRQDVGQSARGVQPGISRQSVGQAERRATSEGSLSLMVDVEPNAEMRLRGGLSRMRECMRGQGGGGEGLVGIS